MPEEKRIHLEEAEIVAHARHPGDQFILRLFAPSIASQAEPGQFVHLQVCSQRPLRRPFSIMHTIPEEGKLDILYKIVGEGTRLLSHRKNKERLSVLGPIGRPFDLTDPERRYVCIGGGVGIPPLIFVAQRCRNRSESIVFAGSELPLPLALQPSQFILPGISSSAMLGITVLEDWGIPSRVATLCGRFGWYSGYVTDMARDYLQAISESERNRTTILACGPEAMLKAAARLAKEMRCPAQLCLEAYMACGVGGCAGCVVHVREKGEEGYRRVCVDGPVFPLDVLPDYC